MTRNERNHTLRHDSSIISQPPQQGQLGREGRCLESTAADRTDFLEIVGEGPAFIALLRSERIESLRLPAEAAERRDFEGHGG